MPEMPLLGRRPVRRRRRVAIVVLLLAGGGFGGWRLFAARHRATPSPPQDAGMPAVSASPAAAALAPDAAPAEPAVDDEIRRAGMRYARAIVDGPLETAVVKQVGRDVGEPLTQVVTRLLVWWVSIPDDLRRGDVLEVLFSERTGAEPLVHAVRFTSGKAGQTFAAYRYQEAGAPFPRYYTRDGQELELRLEGGPLDEYEQVTSLLRDGRGHRGVDLRVPQGTPVKATFDATVVRRNWNFRANGNSLELKERGGAGRSAFFLHLSEIPPEIKVGDRVSRGQVVARSGNTGHSFAPHLHYQLESPSGKLLDPFHVHKTFRKALPDAARAAFDAEVSRLESLLDRGAAAAAKN